MTKAVAMTANVCLPMGPSIDLRLLSGEKNLSFLNWFPYTGSISATSLRYTALKRNSAAEFACYVCPSRQNLKMGVR